jgi:hypothetical protein
MRGVIIDRTQAGRMPQIHCMSPAPEPAREYPPFENIKKTMPQAQENPKIADITGVKSYNIKPDLWMRHGTV